jgi:hypothetical protein
MKAILVRLVLAVFAAMAVAMPADAQLGGLMRKAREAAKEATTEKDPTKSEPATSPGPNPFADPAIVFITQDQLGRFEKALRYEVAQRNELRKSLAALKTPQEYQACTQEAAASPEFLEIMMALGNTDPNASQDQMMKATQKMQTDMAAMVTKRCGADPSQGASQRLERVKQIELEASDIAMPPGYKAPVAFLERHVPAGPAAQSNDWYGAARSPVALSYRARRPLFLEAAPAAGAAQMPNPHPFARAYAMLKERIPVFCAKVEAKANLQPTQITIGTEKVSVVKIPGSGQDYVYRQDEASALTTGCASVMGQLNSLFDTQ